MLTSLNVHGYSVDVLCNMQGEADGFNQIETFCRLNYPNTLREGLGYWLSRVLKFLAWILSAPHFPGAKPCSIDEFLKALLSFRSIEK